jgi:aldehyde:ferredoxin oxidoreductase
MSNLETQFEDLPEEYATFGGRALTSSIVAKEVPPN